MNDTWSAVLALSVAVMAIVQLVVLIVLGVAAKRMMAVADKTQTQVESLSADLRLRGASVSESVSASPRA